MDVVGAFCAAFVEVGGSLPPDADDEQLAHRLDGWVARGRAAHPSLRLDEASFAGHLGRVAARQPSEGPALEALLIEDLFLAAACTLGVAGAAESFEARCGDRLRAAVASATKSEDERREIEQRLRHLLLVGSATEAPKITGYGGQAPLDRWVAVVAQRQVVTAIRAEQAERRARAGAANEATAAALPLHPEIAILKVKYRAAFEAAMTAALGTLEERDRLILRLHLVSGLSVAQVGQMYGVSQSTASRWLAEAREKVQSEMIARLREASGLATSDIQSLVKLVASQLDLDMSRLLPAAQAPK
ncbi:MAG TPA: sigma-70 family RNA polymerase sigma factor [Polyangia bacterium]|jgi:RNA polymerase sigma-70 factor (ECF subfamily)|nr:sigma-70 family RNA polymerase sigma factor [Polyangia bacterium]